MKEPTESDFVAGEITAYKLCRKLKNGDLRTLFIDKKKNIVFDKWLEAGCFPTKGFAVRPYWHSTSLPTAPHLTEKGRVWIECKIRNYANFKRPLQQGGLWYLSKEVMFVRELSSNDVSSLLQNDTIESL